MERRVLLASAVLTAMSPATARAQQTMRVIGTLLGGKPNQRESTLLEAFSQGLAKQGYVIGQNTRLDTRYAEGRYDQLPSLATELVARGADVILAPGLPEARAAMAATQSIPIVYAGGADLVANGLVASLARPGGNLTGVIYLNVELSGKRFELLSELVPHARAIAVLVNPQNPVSVRIRHDVQEAASQKGLQALVVEANSENDIESAFASLVGQGVGGLMIGTDPWLASQQAKIVGLAERHAVPALFGYATDGALISYGTNLVASWRQIGTLVGRILKGAKPADIPVEQSTTFELIVNMKTAKALGVTIPPSILARADEVIE